MSVESRVKFIDQGIVYDELSEADKEIYENTFEDENGKLPEAINSAALNTWIFNEDTIKKVLHVLMRDGIKIEYGQKIGKTIIFAKNHDHAEKILEIFNKEYPHLKNYAMVIDNRMKYAQSAIDEFSDPKKLPQIAISVDMLDTGIGMVVSSVVGMFEKVVTCLPIIMCFQSLILDMAGNVGTQSLAVTIRVLMDETLTGRQKAELVLKEMRIGLCNGGLLGILSFVLIGLYIFLFKGKTLVFAYAVSGCIGLSLLVAMLVSSAVGTCIPLFFKKVGVDPAVASGPLITTMNDLVAVITYYGMSWIFLIEMFHLAG